MDTMKLLGFTLSSRPGIHAHIEALRRKFRQRFWVLIHLRAFGFSHAELVRVYKSVIRPTAEYCAAAFHSQMTDEQDEILERQQSHALKLIFGPGISAGKMREMAGIMTLRQRRIDICDKFANNAVKSPRFQRWFPLRAGRPTRTFLKYEETYARCDRLKNSPIYFMRRRLNGKPGKTYGVRNQFWREA